MLEYVARPVDLEQATGRTILVPARGRFTLVDRLPTRGAVQVEVTPLTAMTSSFARAPAERLKAGFNSMLPKIHQHAWIYFRDIKCPDQRADRVAETVALAWKWYCRLAARGKDATGFPTAFAIMAARAVKSGRRL